MPRILIVDEEPAIRGLLARIFSRAGFDVALAGSTFDAMALCQTKTFDVVLSDVHMPRIDGHELVCWVADNHPRTRSVLMSALAIECEECPVEGRCPLLPKPFVPSEAVALVARVMASH